MNRRGIFKALAGVGATVAGIVSIAKSVSEPIIVPQIFTAAADIQRGGMITVYFDDDDSFIG